MKKVYISYSHDDYDLYHTLVRGLELEDDISVAYSASVDRGDDWQSGVLAAIRGASIFVAVMDDLNPNVLLELGYAMGAGKNVLLLKSSGTRIPSDIAAFPVKTFDRFGMSSAAELADWIREASVVEPQPEEFVNSRDLFVAILDNPELLDSVSPREFERRVFSFLTDLGIEVEETRSHSELGFDMILPEIGAGVEVKKYGKNSRISVSDVQKLVGAAVIASVPSAIIITTGSFTSSARFFSSESPIPILLLSIEELIGMSKEDLFDMASRR